MPSRRPSTLTGDPRTVGDVPRELQLAARRELLADQPLPGGVPGVRTTPPSA